MMNKTRGLFLVDDHLPFREGLKYVLSQEENIEIIAEASDGNEFLEKLDKVRPDVVLMDIAMPGMNGIEATFRARERFPDIRIIALSMFSDDKYYYEMLKAGAKGFVLKEDEVEELILAINYVAEDRLYINSQSRSKLIRSFNIQNNEERTGTVKLSDIEKIVLELTCSGLSCQQVSERTSLPVGLVTTTRKKLLEKTGAENQLGLILYAIRNKCLRED